MNLDMEIVAPSLACSEDEESPAIRIEQYYSEHRDPLHRYLIAAGCRREDAPDLLQEGFLRLFQQLHNGESIQKPRSWLIRVVHHLWLNHIRKSRRETIASEETPGMLEQIADEAGVNPEVQYAERQRLRRTLLAIGQLTPTQFRYLLLRAEGLKFREIAELNGVSIGAVADACGRALRILGERVNG